MEKKDGKKDGGKENKQEERLEKILNTRKMKKERLVENG